MLESPWDDFRSKAPKFVYFDLRYFTYTLIFFLFSFSSAATNTHVVKNVPSLIIDQKLNILSVVPTHNFKPQKKKLKLHLNPSPISNNRSKKGTDVPCLPIIEGMPNQSQTFKTGNENYSEYYIDAAGVSVPNSNTNPSILVPTSESKAASVFDNVHDDFRMDENFCPKEAFPELNDDQSILLLVANDENPMYPILPSANESTLQPQ